MTETTGTRPETARCETCHQPLHRRIVRITDTRYHYMGDRDEAIVVSASAFCSMSCAAGATDLADRKERDVRRERENF